METTFDHDTAFSRTIGWVTTSERDVLRRKRVAIAGLGGVGGRHLLTLTRLGVGAFTLAEMDRFELANFNRQAGATMSTLGEPKLDVLSRTALDINPQLDLRTFPEGVRPGDADAFLRDADLYVDGIDFFAMDARRAVFAACARLGIPAVTAAPLGHGAALLVFMPGGMTFEEYFRLDGCAPDEQFLRFLVGLAPAGLHRGSLVDPTAVDLARRRGPSTPMACEMCASLAGTEALKILLGRGPVRAAPRGLQIDAYTGRIARTWRPGGNRNPLQRLALWFAHRSFRRRPESAPDISVARSPVERILDAARYAPSGDNTQPWRFEIAGDRQVVVHGRDTRRDCVYDLDGHGSHLALGALLETIKVAASGFRLRADVERRLDVSPERPTFDVRFRPDESVRPDRLLGSITRRATNRGLLSTLPLMAAERSELAAAAGPTHRVAWFEGLRARWRVARLLFRSGGIRLAIPEAYNVHRRVIAWHARTSEDRIPDQALGLDRVTLAVMRWAMASWERVRFLNRYLAGSLLPRVELDLLPALFCGAHFALVADREPESTDDWIDTGRALQRFWLTATRLGLQMQPEMTPLIFARYAREGRVFSSVEAVQPRAAQLDARLAELFAGLQARAMFLGRIGMGPAPDARSLRRPLAALTSAASPAASPGDVESSRGAASPSARA